ncbi:MAG TPA: CocE/NonD family hydrolase [Steroidobacteraceae bacterium]|jgi:putative ATP-binding cassette transporter|nr:CocE/NonD family hydrolase [Steroidobacteraceae bacterium]
MIGRVEMAGTLSEPQEGAHARLLPQLRMMLRALVSSPVGKTLLLLAAGLLVVIVATAYGQIRLNRWNKPFYDALSRRDFYAFLYQLGVFGLIAGSLLVLNVAQRWLTEMLKLKLREGLVRDLLHDWMQPRRALMLANAGAIGVNPDQRMHEDARHLCELSADLGGGLLQSSILLLSFVGVLWVISAGFAIRIAGRDIAIPGYMVWAAIVYAGIGSLLSYRVGRSLIPRNAERYAHEADLRFSLVRVNEHLDGISLASGEAGETRRVELNLAGVLAAMRRLVSGLTNLTWITAGFGWVTQVAPIIVAAPLYFQGTLSFGGLMMAAAAFSQAQSSLSWFVENFSTIADWRATLLRVANFRRALINAESLGHVDSRIDYVDGEPGLITLENLEVASASGRDRLRESSVQIRAGERVLIVGEPGTGKTQLFRALAGLWPWGGGRVIRPKDEPIQYLPRGTPYLPRGSLREVLAYPGRPEIYEEDAYVHALRRVGLERLVPMLQQTHRWDRELSQEEQLGLAFARIALQRPPWLIVDDTFGSLDGETLARVIDLFANELEHTSVIHIGSTAARDPLFSRVVHLAKAGSGPRPIAPLALLLALALLWPALSRAAAPEQQFQFPAPTVLNDAATTKLMRDLAVRVLPVYQDSDRIRYLATLSALQMVAGDYPAAYASRQALRERLGKVAGPLPIEQSVAYDLYAHTEAIEAQRHAAPFGQAFQQSFNAVVPQLDDLSDFALTTWFRTPLAVFQDVLAGSFQSVRAKRVISLSEAVQLVWAYLAYQVHRTTAPQADELIQQDDQRRYITDEHVLIRARNGVLLPAMLVRPRDAAAPLPTLLEFTIYLDPDNDAKECAAHGYVGVVAYTRDKVAGHGHVVPYEHDGEDARTVIDWIAKQPWSDGRVGMYGSGYSGFTPWAALKRRVPALKAIATFSAVAPGIDAPRLGNVYLNSAYRWGRYVTGSGTSNDAAYADQAHWSALNQAWYRSGRPYRDLPRLDGKPDALFSRWLRHPSYDRYWQAMIPYRQEFAHIPVPVLSITGYYDSNEPGELYYLLQQQRYDRQADHTLLIGPYADLAAHAPAAALQPYPVDPVAFVNVHELRYRWFDHIFKGAALPPLLQGRVNFEVAGANRWEHAASVETMADRSLRLYLDPAPSDLPPAAQNHQLVSDKPAHDKPEHDKSGRGKPAHGKPARGNPPKPAFVAQSVNFADRSDADWMAPEAIRTAGLPTHDSVVFVSAPLRAPMQIAGLLAGQLDFSVNKYDLDLTLALYERLLDGTYVKLFAPADELRASYAQDRSQRRLLRAGVREQLRFVGEHLMSRSLQPGSRLVLVLSVVKRPDQQINYGAAEDVSVQSIADAKVPLQIRWYDGSYIDLPTRQPPQPAGPVPPRQAPTAPSGPVRPRQPPARQAPPRQTVPRQAPPAPPSPAPAPPRPQPATAARAL